MAVHCSFGHAPGHRDKDLVRFMVDWAECSVQVVVAEV